MEAYHVMAELLCREYAADIHKVDGMRNVCDRHSLAVAHALLCIVNKLSKMTCQAAMTAT